MVTIRLMVICTKFVRIEQFIGMTEKRKSKKKDQRDITSAKETGVRGGPALREKTPCFKLETKNLRKKERCKEKGR